MRRSSDDESSPPQDLRSARILRALAVGGEELWEINVTRGTFTRLCNSLGVAGAHDGDEISISELQGTAHPEDRDLIQSGIAACLQQPGTVIEVTYRARSTDDRWLWIMVRGRCMQSADGETLIIGASRDVTAIKADAERLSLALRSAGEEMWEVDLTRDSLRRENVHADLDLPVAVAQGAREALANFIHPEDRDILVSAFQRAVSGQQGTFGAAYRARTQDGQYRWLDSQGMSLDPTADGVPTRIIGTTRDISPQKAHEARMQLALWGSEAELWDVDMIGQIIVREFLLPQFDLGNGRERIEFRALLDQTHPDDREPFAQLLRERIRSGDEAVEAVFRMRNREGVWRWLVGRARVVERNAQGIATRMMGTLQDISDIKRAEEQLRELNEALEQRVALRTLDLQRANLALQQSLSELQATQRRMVDSEKMAALGGLVAGVAHEINTPIGVSVTAASHLADVLTGVQQRAAAKANGVVSPELQTALEASDIVLRNLRRADALIRSFKQVATDQTDDQLRRLDLSAYINEVLLALTPAFKRRDVVVDVTCRTGLLVTTYPGAIYQVLSNLLMNSIRHGFPGERGGHIGITVSEVGASCHIVYRDDGVGMSEEVRKRIFEPFFTTRRHEGGSGLGMHIAFNLVSQRLRGHIDVESSPEKGACFTIDFPLVLGGEPET
jgi:PAS domain S-box-containing protein